MPDVFENVELTDTTTSYRVDIDYVNLEESLDDGYARNWSQYEERERTSDESNNERTPVRSE